MQPFEVEKTDNGKEEEKFAQDQEVLPEKQAVLENQIKLSETINEAPAQEETKNPSELAQIENIREGEELLFNPPEPPVFPQSKGQAELHETFQGIAEVKSTPQEHSNHPANCLLLAGTTPYNKWLVVETQATLEIAMPEPFCIRALAFKSGGDIPSRDPSIVKVFYQIEQEWRMIAEYNPQWNE